MGQAEDKVELERLMREEGLTAWVASTQLRNSGRTDRSQSTLFHHAKRIEAKIAAEEAPPTDEWVSAIEDGQALLIEEGSADLVRRALKAAGIEWTESSRKAFRYEWVHIGAASPQLLRRVRPEGDYAQALLASR